VLEALGLRHAALSAQAAGLYAALDPLQLQIQTARSETLRVAGRVQLDPRAHPAEWVAQLTTAQADGANCLQALQFARAAQQAVQELRALNDALAALNLELAPLTRVLKRCREWASVSTGGPLVATFN
jgi:hypothetical protein